MQKYLILIGLVFLFVKTGYAQKTCLLNPSKENNITQFDNQKTDVIQIKTKNEFTYVAKPITSLFTEEYIGNETIFLHDADKAMWDVSFWFLGNGYANPAVCTDGKNFYTANFWKLIDGGGFFTRYNMDGSNPVNFYISGVEGMQNIAYDGEYFYTVDASWNIRKLDLENETIISTFSAYCEGLSMIRALTYDPTLDNGNGGFWVCDWMMVGAISKTGTQLIAGINLDWSAPTGIAYDPYTDVLNPCIWLSCQTSPNNATIKQFDINSLSLTSVSYDIVQDNPIHNSGSGQGACAYNNGNGKFLLAVNLATTPPTGGKNVILVYELCDVAHPNAPAPVSNFTVTPGTFGALNVEFTWTNPNITTGGGSLSQLTTIKIYENDNLIHTVSNPTIGEHCSYSVSVSTEGEYTYKVVAENSFGKSEPAFEIVWIGHDVPAATENVTLIRNGNVAELSWNAVTTGLHEGYFTASGIEFDIYRFPDEVKVASDLTVLNYTETVLGQGYYYYKVVAKNDIGIGGYTISNVGIFCETKTLPYFEGFENNGNKLPVCWENEFIILDTPWSIVDGNQGQPFDCPEGNYKLRMRSRLINPQITKLVTPPINISNIENPALTFWHAQRDLVGWDILKVFYKTSPTGEWNLLVEYLDEVRDWTKHTLALKDASDTYFLSFEASVYGGFGIFLDAISVFDARILKGQITASGNPIIDAKVEIIGTDLFAYTDNLGYYQIIDVNSGTYNIKASKLGYYDIVENVVLEESVTTKDFELTLLPLYTVSGKVKGSDAPYGIEGVAITLLGYANFYSITNAEGNYSIPNVYGDRIFSISAKKAGYIPYNNEINVTDNITRNITLDEHPSPAVNPVAKENLLNIEISWEEPIIGTPSTFRYDSGIVSGQLGFNGEAPRGVMGSCHNTGAILDKIQWFLTNDAQYPTSNVNIYIFDLNSNGLPTNKILFSAFNIPTSIMQWNEFVFPFPVVASNGFLIALSRPSGTFLSIGTTVPTQQYPFLPQTHYFCSDYTTTGFTALESQNLNVIFMLRAEGIIAESGKSAQFGCPFASKSATNYRVYRLLDGNQNNEATWTTLSETVSGLSCFDNGWLSATEGIYRWAVKAEYTGGVLSTPQFSNTLAKGMRYPYKVNLTTNSGEPVVGAVVKLTNKDGDPAHIYTEKATGETVNFPEVWKGTYEISIKLKDFQTYFDTNILIDKAGLSHDAKLIEILAPVTNPLATNSSENVVISWDAPGWLPEFNDWIKQCVNDEVVRQLGWGATTGGDMTAAIRFTPSDLANLGVVSGHTITTIVLGVGTDMEQVSSMEIKIWEGGTSITNAGELVFTQIITNFSSFTENAINEVSLKTPYIIDASKELRIGYRVVNTGGFPIGGDSGPIVSGKGNLLQSPALQGGVWIESNTVAQNWYRNFTIKAWVTSDMEYKIKSLLNYSVYRLIQGQQEISWTLLSNNVSVLTFTDTNWYSIPAEKYQWAVKANYSSGHSEAVLTNTLEKPSGIDIHSITDITLYPNPFTNEINISNPDLIKGVQITNVAGQKIKSGVFDGKPIPTKDLASGVYFVIIESVNNEKVVYKMVKK